MNKPNLIKRAREINQTVIDAYDSSLNLEPDCPCHTVNCCERIAWIDCEYCPLADQADENPETGGYEDTIHCLQVAS